MVNVRNSSSATAPIIKAQPAGIYGTIISGPVNSDGYSWYQVRYDDGTTGWTANRWLITESTQTTTVTPTAPNITEEQRQTLIRTIQAQLSILIRQLIILLTQQAQNVGALILNAYQGLMGR